MQSITVQQSQPMRPAARPPNNSKSMPGFGPMLTPLPAKLQGQLLSEDHRELEECSESEYEFMLESDAAFGEWHEQRGSFSTLAWILPRTSRRKSSIMSVGSASKDGRSLSTHRRSAQRSIAGSASYNQQPFISGSPARMISLRNLAATEGVRRQSAMSSRSAASSKTDQEEEQRVRRFQLMDFDLDRRFSEIVQVDLGLDSDSDSDVDMSMAPARANNNTTMSLWCPETTEDGETDDGSNLQSFSPLPTPSLTLHMGLAFYSSFHSNSVALYRPLSVETPMADTREVAGAETNPIEPVAAVTRSLPPAPPTDRSRPPPQGRPALSRAVSSPMFAFQASPLLKQGDFPGRKRHRAGTLHGPSTTQPTFENVLCSSSPGMQAASTPPIGSGGRPSIEALASAFAEFRYLAAQITTVLDKNRKLSTSMPVQVNETDISYFSPAPKGAQEPTNIIIGGEFHGALWPLPARTSKTTAEYDSSSSPPREESSTSPVRPVTRRRPVSMEALVQTIRSPQLRTAGLGIIYDAEDGSSPSRLQTAPTPARRNPLKRATTDPLVFGRFPITRGYGQPSMVSYHTSPKSPCIPTPSPQLPALAAANRSNGPLPSPSKQVQAERAFQEYRDGYLSEPLATPEGHSQPSQPVATDCLVSHHQHFVPPTPTNATSGQMSQPRATTLHRPKYLHRNTAPVDDLATRRSDRLPFRPPPMSMPKLPRNARESPIILPPKALRFNLSPDLAERHEHRRQQARLAQVDNEKLSEATGDQCKLGRNRQVTTPSSGVHLSKQSPTSLFSQSYTMHSPVETASPSIESAESHESQRRPALVRHAYSNPPVHAVQYTAPLSHLHPGLDGNEDQKMKRPLYHSRAYTDNQIGNSSSRHAGSPTRYLFRNDSEVQAEKIPTPMAPKMSWNRMFSGPFSNKKKAGQ